MITVAKSREVEPAELRLGAPVDQVERIDGSRFLSDYIRQNRPLVMLDMASQWPAMQKWSFEFFRDLGATQTIHLEAGNVMQQKTEFRKERFAEYVERLMTDEADQERGYLSVFRIFDAFPHLRDDVDFRILDQHKIKSSTSGWIGPAGTVTGYHIDWGDNILAQISGRKCVHLAAPAETPNMYAGSKFDQGTTISEVNVDEYDQKRFPRFANVTHQRVTLNPGEMIFIPRGWWHHVRSLDRSISVSNIAFDLTGIVRDVLPHRIKQYLHNAGLWRCDCTCHLIKDGKWVRK